MDTGGAFVEREQIKDWVDWQKCTASISPEDKGWVPNPPHCGPYSTRARLPGHRRAGEYTLRTAAGAPRLPSSPQSHGAPAREVWRVLASLRFLAASALALLRPHRIYLQNLQRLTLLLFLSYFNLQKLLRCRWQSPYFVRAS